MDRVVTGHITTEEQIDENVDKIYPSMRPTERAKLKGFLGDFLKAKQENLQNSPQWQAEQLNNFDELLKDYVPVTGDSEDKPGVALMAIVKGMPQGALRDDMERRVGAVLDNQKYEAQTNLDLALEEVTAAAATGRLVPKGKPEEFDTDQAIRKGFFHQANKPMLQSLGFSAKQAESIIEEDDNNKRRNKFNSLWPDRENKSAKGSAWAEGVKDAILRGDSKFTLSQYDEESYKAAVNQKAGEIKIRMLDWARKNPEAARDPVKIREELKRIGGPVIRANHSRINPKPTTTGAQPTETSMNIPKAGIKLSNYGYASDTTPDSFSARGIGHRDNKLIPGESAAISKSLATRLGLEHGDKVRISTTKGDFEVYYHDTVPSYDKRTGPLPETIDIYRPKDGSNSWGGRVKSITKIS
jgi:anaerobic selenocysteine-containing dehydrogenase